MQLTIRWWHNHFPDNFLAKFIFRIGYSKIFLSIIRGLCLSFYILVEVQRSQNVSIKKQKGFHFFFWRKFKIKKSNKTFEWNGSIPHCAFKQHTHCTLWIIQIRLSHFLLLVLTTSTNNEKQEKRKLQKCIWDSWYQDIYMNSLYYTCKKSPARRSKPSSDASDSGLSGTLQDNLSVHLRTVSWCH